MKNLFLVSLFVVSTMARADVEIIEVPRPAPTPAPVVTTQVQVAPQPIAYFEQHVILDPYAPFRDAHFASLRQAQIAHGGYGEVMRAIARIQINRGQRYIIGFDVTVYANGRYYTVPMDHQPPVGATVFFAGR